MLGMFVTRPEVCVFAPQAACSHQPEVSLCMPSISHLTLTPRLSARSRSGMVRTLERVESTVDKLLSKTTIASQPRRRPLHSTPLAHLGFENPFEESYITHPHLLYRLIRRDSMPTARVLMPSPHTPKFKFQSE